MKKLILGMLFLSAIANSLHESVQGLDPADLRKKIETQSEITADKIANPITSSHWWKAAHTAYVFNGLVQGYSLNNLLTVGQEQKISGEMRLISQDGEHICVQTPFPFEEYNDKPLVPYFTRALKDWDGLSESIENDWKHISSELKKKPSIFRAMARFLGFLKK